MKKRIPIVLIMFIVTAGSMHAQLIFEKSEYALRREKLIDMIGRLIAVNELRVFSSEKSARDVWTRLVTPILSGQSDRRLLKTLENIPTKNP
jgi:hypothetical protein